ncbi:MAG TPA: radical SAM protein [Chitinispirillaceae bacterium]|jgi:spore photoproduct lyase|nr:radical SAM protein [Chitinispirillaceae bacterium]
MMQIDDLQNIPPEIASNRAAVITARNRGEFWKPCPGTSGYLCCGYQIITPSTGCGMYCKYCILQAYFPYQCQVLFENLDDLEREIKSRLDGRKDIIRFGTGEFGDSLFSEKRFGVAGKIASLLQPYPNVIVEFKTKSADISALSRIKNPEKVIIGFSLNTPVMIKCMERGTASLQQRLDAAARCIEMGFFVAFHFDPMFIYDNWEQEYRDVVKAIFWTVSDPEKIAWISMGGFRSMLSLKTFLKKKGEHLPLFSGEMISGVDGKLRYFRPLRVALYRAMVDEFNRHCADITLYLCMESPEVWEEAGMMERIPEGLAKYLDKSAARMLKLPIA